MMEDDYKSVFDNIHAEEKLKSSTIAFLNQEIRKQKKVKSNILYKKTAIIFTLFIIALFSTSVYRIYLTPRSYINLEVNPSIELAVNRFDRIVGVYAYNMDGEEILLDVSLKHKHYDDALAMLIKAIYLKGYIKDGGLVSVTLNEDEKNNEEKMLADIQARIEGFLTENHINTQVDVFEVSRDIWNYAHELLMSPAKYVAIQELIEVEPDLTIEGCRHRSIRELKELVQEHEENHHGMDNGYNRGGCGSGHHGKGHE